MAASHKPRTAAYPVPWAEQATAEDAYHFAKRECGALVVTFYDAANVGNNDSMVAAVKKLRGVVDKLDAFRRMKVREWNAAKSANRDIGEVES